MTLFGSNLELVMIQKKLINFNKAIFYWSKENLVLKLKVIFIVRIDDLGRGGRLRCWVLFWQNGCVCDGHDGVCVACGLFHDVDDGGYVSNHGDDEL